jgi:hypothetical protein
LLVLLCLLCAGLSGLVGSVLMVRRAQARLREWTLPDPENFEAPWIEVELPLPQGAEAYGRVTFMRRAAHPVLAEYDRKLRVQPPDDPAQEIEMPMNVGGRTLINVYWIEQGIDGQPTLQFIDHWGMVLLNLTEPSAGVTRLSRIDGAWRLSVPDEHYGSLAASEAETVAFLDSLGAPSYLGRLDGTDGPLQFVPASVSPEQAIDFVGE